MDVTKKQQQVVLHVGCGPQPEERLHPQFKSAGWRQVSVDSDGTCNPDIVASMTDLSMLDSDTFDAVWSSHNRGRTCRPTRW